MGKPTYDEVVDSLMDMAEQHLHKGDRNALTHGFMSAGEECLDTLERIGKVKTDDGVTFYSVYEVDDGI